MKNKGIKQTDIIKLLSEKQPVVSKWLSLNENIRLDIPNTVLAKIANYLDVDIEYLLGLQDEKRATLSTIPLIGIASCGVPSISYNDSIEQIPVSDNIARDGVYAVTADGDSMLPRIKHGDIVICDREMECVNGNIVHYTTADGESGLKLYQCDPATELVTLYPLNTDGHFPTIVHRDVLRCARAFKIQSDL